MLTHKVFIAGLFVEFQKIVWGLIIIKYRKPIIALSALLLTLVATDMAQGVTPEAPGLSALADQEQVRLYWAELNDPSIIKWQYQIAVDIMGESSRPWWNDTPNFGPWIDIPDSDARTYTHTVTGLDTSNFYSFRVRAVNANGNGMWSEDVVGGIASTRNTLTLSTSQPNPIVEANSGLKTIAITVTLSEPVSSAGGQPVNIYYDSGISSASGQRTCSGRQAADDVCGPTSVTIAQGTRSAIYPLSIVGDTHNEGNETVYLRATAGSASSWASDLIRLVIADDEGDTATSSPTSLHAPVISGTPTSY